MYSKELNPDTLYSCDHYWGNDVSFPKGTQVGKDSWFETKIDHVIGLSGNDTGEGPGLVIEDIEHSDVDMLWTSGLNGCMGLAILGINPVTKKTDVFFTHARHYEKNDATTDKDNPMSLARQFVQSHEGIRVFWGTDFTKYGSQTDAKRQEAQKKLSNTLGCWVRSDDCFNTAEMTFFPKHSLLIPKLPPSAYKDYKEDNNRERKKEFSDSKQLGEYKPDPSIEGEIRLHIAALRKDRTSSARLYHQDKKRDLKIQALTEILEAYHVGNYDVLRQYQRAAEENKSPYMDPDGKKIWDSTQGKTVELAQKAAQDAFNKIRDMGKDGCGLQENGEPIPTYRQYHPKTNSELSSSFL
ncbi:hypothetical protein [Legionella resiliens]|uniref:Dot/Icm T4SS effector n=1 Tax=Legionella resiliens TaxID=2905958 RepID=A0ABS8WX31_9GAMM|nr:MULTISPECIES: hypothetical protein [unclassified Legionella]MCE0721892.1 hypothetical protein [Legionella sp. 9fVS26]MCE3531046.1 hypothetical protein [Legionella sp. 8cVS16]